MTAKRHWHTWRYDGPDHLRRDPEVWTVRDSANKWLKRNGGDGHVLRCRGDCA